MSSKIFLLVLCSTVAVIHGPQEAHAITAEQDAAIDEMAEEFRINSGVPAFSLTIVDNQDGQLIGKAYGLKNLMDELPTKNSTVFGVGSISKGFTATLVVKVLSETFPDYGESVLDRPIKDLAPAFNFSFSDRLRYESISFRDLLAHRVCVDTQDLQHAVGGFNMSIQESLYRSRYLPSTCGIRTSWNYNNAMYALAGEVAASLAGKTYKELFQSLMDDIGMEDTLVLDTTVDESTADLASPYYKRDGEVLKLNTQILQSASMAAPGGGVMSSSRDMAKYLNFHMNFGKVGEVQVIRDDVMKWLQISAFAYRGFEYKQNEGDYVHTNYAYGLGFEIGTMDGFQVLAHGGSLQPYTSTLRIYPAKKLAIYTAVNGPTLYVDHGGFHNRIYQYLRGTTPPAPMSQKPMKSLEQVDYYQPLFPKVNLKTLKPLARKMAIGPEDMVGVFGNPVWGDVEVTYNGTDLHVNYGRWFSAFMIEQPEEAESLYLLESDSEELDSIMLLQVDGNSGNVPRTYLQFTDEDTIWFVDPYKVFTRDAGVDSYPAQPWASDSCAP